VALRGKKLAQFSVQIADLVARFSTRVIAEYNTGKFYLLAPAMGISYSPQALIQQLFSREC
jgi:hypothetical protein